MRNKVNLPNELNLKEHEGIFQNMEKNCSKSVFVFIAYILAMSIDNNMYFRSKTGVNLGFIKTPKYNSDIFAGYLGFGKYNGETLTTAKVKEYVKNKEVLKVDFSGITAGKDMQGKKCLYSGGKVKINYYDGSNNTSSNNKLYYCRNMQYNINKTNKGKNSVFDNFDEVVELYVELVKKATQVDTNLTTIQYDDIDALEIILPRSEGSFVPVLAARLFIEGLDEYYNINYVNKVYGKEDFDKLYEQIATKLVDYRMGEISKIDESSIHNWINQFNIKKVYKYKILYELNYMLENFYYSRSKIKGILGTLLVENKYGIFNKSITYKNEIKDITFINSEQKGSSQSELLKIVNEIMKEKYNIDINECQNSNKYLYIDDCIFTGNTLINDLKRYVEKNNIKDSKIYIFTIVAYNKSFTYIDNKLEELFKERDIKFRRYHSREINNKNNASNIEVLNPKFIEDVYVKKYISNLKGNICTKGLYYNGSDIYRKTEIINEKLFKDPKNRDVIEKVFTVYGCRIADEYLKNKSCKDSSIRPLGFEKLLTLGFGSMFITYRNIANCCPLVLWADSNWIPLIPRKTNKDS